MKRQRLCIHFPVVFLLILCFVSLDVNAVSGKSAKEEIMIERYPDEAIYQLENMKPGDIAYRTLTIKNNNKRDLFYTMELNNVGDPALYNELLLRIMYLDEVVFYGKLKDYEGVVDRPLTAQAEEIIEFDLKFPEELGNEYQGLTAAFRFEFTARTADDESLISTIAKGEGDSLSNPGKGIGSVLPKTATHIFTYLFIGFLLLIIGGLISYLNERKRRLQA